MDPRRFEMNSLTARGPGCPGQPNDANSQPTQLPWASRHAPDTLPEDLQNVFETEGDEKWVDILLGHDKQASFPANSSNPAPDFSLGTKRCAEEMHPRPSATALDPQVLSSITAQQFAKRQCMGSNPMLVATAMLNASQPQVNGVPQNVPQQQLYYPYPHTNAQAQASQLRQPGHVQSNHPPLPHMLHERLQSQDSQYIQGHRFPSAGQHSIPQSHMSQFQPSPSHHGGARQMTSAQPLQAQHPMQGHSNVTPRLQGRHAYGGCNSCMMMQQSSSQMMPSMMAVQQGVPHVSHGVPIPTTVGRPPGLNEGLNDGSMMQQFSTRADESSQLRSSTYQACTSGSVPCSSSFTPGECIGGAGSGAWNEDVSKATDGLMRNACTGEHNGSSWCPAPAPADSSARPSEGAKPQSSAIVPRSEHAPSWSNTDSKDVFDDDDEMDELDKTNPSMHRKVRHNLAERRRTDRINKLFTELYDLLASPAIAPLCVVWDGKGAPPQGRKLPRRSKAAVLEAAITCIENLQRAVTLLDRQGNHARDTTRTTEHEMDLPQARITNRSGPTHDETALRAGLQTPLIAVPVNANVASSHNGSMSFSYE